MTINSMKLFQAIGQKMDYLNTRQQLIARNIANSDTPGFKPQDLKPVDFADVLGKVAGVKELKVDRTVAGHLTPGGDVLNPKAAEQKKVFEVAPAGNAVIIEEQMVKSNQVAMDYNLMLNLYQRNMNMLRTALGRGG